MALATLEVFRMRYQAFCDQFGRDPEPDEPLFFDPAQQIPVPPEPSVIRSQVMEAAAATRVDAKLVLDFMSQARRKQALESTVEPRPWRYRAPERDQPDWLPALPEEPAP